jgi:hypothetical protein
MFSSPDRRRRSLEAGAAAVGMTAFGFQVKLAISTVS